MAAEWKVRLSCHGSQPEGEVVFEASPIVGEQRGSSWDGYNITHLPTGILSYKNTGSRKFDVQAKLISRTPEEADMHAYYLNLIRSWILPDFGGTGAVPPICRFSVYNNENISRLPVILESYSWTFPDDVDYIHTSTTPMPVIGTISITLQEIWSPEEITNQEWKMYFNAPIGSISPAVQFLGTPSVATLGTDFVGVMNRLGGGMRAPNGSPMSATPPFNPNASTMGIMNSPQISVMPQSPFSLGTPPGGLSGVPVPPLATPTISPRDGFNRGSFSLDSLITG